MVRLKQLFALALVVTILIPLGLSASTLAQVEDRAQQLMALMSDEAKVGQLFLLAFPGGEVAEDAVIAELIRDYHIGGVVLLPENGNIVNEGNTPAQVSVLASQLQKTAWAATHPVTETLVEEGEEAGEEERDSLGPFIPLFIAVSHEGNGMPFTSIVNGMTPLPSEMALGATWNLAYAETIGQVVGQDGEAIAVTGLDDGGAEEIVPGGTDDDVGPPQQALVGDRVWCVAEMDDSIR